VRAGRLGRLTRLVCMFVSLSLRACLVFFFSFEPIGLKLISPYKGIVCVVLPAHFCRLHVANAPRSTFFVYMTSSTAGNLE
jgi:hypothetical protein